jgi:hypothetical protein
MNWTFMLDEAFRTNPNFWFELSTWDGYEPTLPNDKRKFYLSICAGVHTGAIWWNDQFGYVADETARGP